MCVNRGRKRADKARNWRDFAIKVTKATQAHNQKLSLKVRGSA